MEQHPGLYAEAPPPQPGDPLPGVDPRLLAAMESAGVLSTREGDAPLEVLTARLSGSYSWGSKWRGWIEHGEGIGFVDTESRGLWWASRSETGAVVGDPVAFAWLGPIDRFDDGALPTRADLGEPRLFAMVRAADESGTSGTGRVMDGVLWPDGSVATRWRSEAPGGENFASWTIFHKVHACAHPGNGTTFPFADGGEAPACDACGGAGPAKAGAEAVADAGAADGATYPLDVRTLPLPASARALAETIAAKLPGSKFAAKADGLELTLPPEIAGPTADAMQAMTDYVRSMAGDLAAADDAAGKAAAALVAEQDKVAKLNADAAEVAEILAERAKVKRDELIAQAKLVAPKLDAIDDKATDAEIRKAAVKARGVSLVRDSDDAIAGAYAGLVAGLGLVTDTAGGRDPAEKSEPKPKDPIPPVERPKPADKPAGKPTPTPKRDESALYMTDGDDDGE